MMLQVRLHVPQSDDLVAEMTFRCASSVCKFVGRHAGHEDFRRGIKRIAFLRNFKVAEAAENELPGTDACVMPSKVW
jgi:hypothetical protein